MRSSAAPEPLVQWTARYRAYAVIAAILTGSVLAGFSGRELWPFSPYPMYSWVERDRAVRRLQLYGVTGTPPHEFALSALRYLRPFDDARLTSAFWALWRRPDDPAEVREALVYCLHHYEDLRRQDRHDGPPLDALRLYVLDWYEIDSSASTRTTPDHRLLALEVRSDEAWSR